MMGRAAMQIRRATMEDAEAIGCLAYGLTARHSVSDVAPKGRETLLRPNDKRSD
jgi:hypothetical protein